MEATRVCQSHVAPIELVLEHPFLSEQTRAAFHVGISHPKSFCSCSLSAACSSAYGTRGCAQGRPSPASRRMLYSRAVVLRVAYSSRRDALRAYPTRARTEPPNAVADATRCERIRNFISSDQPLRASPTSATRLVRSPLCLTAVQLQGSGAHDTHGCGALDSRFQIRAGPSGWTLEHGIACLLRQSCQREACGLPTVRTCSTSGGWYTA